MHLPPFPHHLLAPPPLPAEVGATFYFGDLSDSWTLVEPNFIKDITGQAGIPSSQLTLGTPEESRRRQLLASSCSSGTSTCLAVDIDVRWTTYDVSTVNPDDFVLAVMNNPSSLFASSNSFALRSADVNTGGVMSSGGITVSTPSYPPPPPLPPPPPPACSVDPCYPGVECYNSELSDLAPEGWTCGACISGYEGSGIGDAGCADVDECSATPNGGCHNLTSCVNSIGSFTCTDCPPGTSGTGLQGCSDDDECLVNNGGCDFIVDCINVLGSFACGDCPAGYSGDGYTGCVDIDECQAADGGGCDALTTCVNKPGTSTCSACPWGYSGSGLLSLGGCKYAMSCEDEGEEGWQYPCALPEVSCQEVGGFVECGDCPPGFAGVGSISCVDIDGCAAQPCWSPESESPESGSLHVPCLDIAAPGVGFDCFSLCNNATGNCCPAGYVGDGMTCNKDLCATGEACHPQASSCGMLSTGQAECGTCVAGFVGDGRLAGSSCTDVDECATGNGGCHYLAECFNHDGGFECGSCPTGYRGDGVTCTIPTTSCEDANGGCFMDGAMLAECTDLDTDGVTRIDPVCGACPAGYEGDGVSCKDIPGCYDFACYEGVTCVDVRAPGTGFTCGDCPTRYLGDGFGNASGVEGYTGCYVNKCFDNNGGCATTCENDPSEVSGRKCGACDPGFRDEYNDGTSCVDAEGCDEMYGDPCFPGVKCTDIRAPGTGRVCEACPTGYEGDGDICVDIDECAVDHGGCYRNGTVVTTCINTLRDVDNPKGRACGPCPEGYIGSGETTCELITTCAMNNGGCWYGRGDEAWASTTCKDISDGTECGACPPGFTGTGVTGCIDTDGCAEDPCFAGVTCVDVKAPGTGHTCTYQGVDWRCPEGYKGDGMSCTQCAMISSITDSTIAEGKTNRIGSDRGERVLIVGQLTGLDSPNCTNIQGTTFEWTGTASDSSKLVLTAERNKANTLKLNMPKTDLQVKLSYQVAMTSYLVGNPDVSSSSRLEFYVQSLDLVVRITGGGILTGEENALTLSASASSDPDGNPLPMLYEWKCFRDDQTDVCRYRPDSDQSDTDALAFPSSFANETIGFTLLGSFTGVNYTFSCTVSKGDRSTTKTTRLTIFRGKPPVPVIEPLTDSKANPTSSLTLKSSVTSEDADFLVLTWTAACTNAGLDGMCNAVTMDSTDLMTPVDGEDLVIRANVLSPGATYIFTLWATDRIGPSSAEIEVEMNTPPEPGGITVSPINGTMLETYFTIKAPSWKDDDLPLKYQMAYRVKGSGSDVWNNLIADFTPLGGSNGAAPQISSSIPDPGLESEQYGVEVRVTVVDNLGAKSFAMQEIAVFEPEVLDADKLMDDASFALSNGDIDDTLRVIKGLSGSLNADAYEYLDNVTNASTYYNVTDKCVPCPTPHASPPRLFRGARYTACTLR
ncbi:hypothetical protein CYMTET_18539 [Cymbomonas tetramitiformis]|uniref:EGF-like domain-containing protein n=1 Tax=Cymbomonas tetramitiformis TaxID=36881 RepID=A0AAE0L654_9CHLO|nr:hypothetical protein CYMTET_18539 [Cymbomonas tetramitiformis]